MIASSLEEILTSAQQAGLAEILSQLRNVEGRLAKHLTAVQVELIENGFFELENHGWGSIEIVYREGKVIGINVTRQNSVK